MRGLDEVSDLEAIATGSIPSGCNAGWENTPDMPELEENPSARRTHSIGDETPALDLLAAMNAGCPRVALALHRDLGRLADDHRGARTLDVVGCIERRRDITGLACA